MFSGSWTQYSQQLSEAFRTTSTLSLCAETTIMPLHYRRIKLIVNLLLSVAPYFPTHSHHSPLSPIPTNPSYSYMDPGHADTAPHDLVDRGVKSVTNLSKASLTTTLPLSDFKNVYHNDINSVWSPDWNNQTSNKLYQIKPHLKPWFSSDQNSR